MKAFNDLFDRLMRMQTMALDAKETDRSTRAWGMGRRTQLPTLSESGRQALRKESVENINRMPPVRLSSLRAPAPKKKDKAAISWDVISVPTKAELDYQQNGLTLPQKVENLEKLLSDYEKTGKFDYELCYLLRKQEAQEDLKKWIGKVIQKRRVGDNEFGKESDTMRFNDLIESTVQKVKGKQLFRDAFVRSLQESSAN